MDPDRAVYVFGYAAGPTLGSKVKGRFETLTRELASVDGTDCEKRSWGFMTQSNSNQQRNTGHRRFRTDAPTRVQSHSAIGQP